MASVRSTFLIADIIPETSLHRNARRGRLRARSSLSRLLAIAESHLRKLALHHGSEPRPVHLHKFLVIEKMANQFPFGLGGSAAPGAATRARSDVGTSGKQTSFSNHIQFFYIYIYTKQVIVQIYYLVGYKMKY